jgi:hypothetical protein
LDGTILYFLLSAMSFMSRLHHVLAQKMNPMVSTYDK